jgi:hypothetical protein
MWVEARIWWKSWHGKARPRAEPVLRPVPGLELGFGGLGLAVLTGDERMVEELAWEGETAS